MGNQTGFSLEEHVASWRAELHLEESLSEERLRELESHLRDATARWQKEGLSEEEAFWLARRRMGTSKTIVAEFTKAEPVSEWRNRAFWMIVGIWGCNVYWAAIRFLTTSVHYLAMPTTSRLPEQVFPHRQSVTLIEHILLALLLFWFVEGSAARRFRALNPSQTKLVLVVITPALFIPALNLLGLQTMNLPNPLRDRLGLIQVFLYLVMLFTTWPMIAAVMAIHFSPFKHSKPTKRHA